MRYCIRTFHTSRKFSPPEKSVYGSYATIDEANQAALDAVKHINGSDRFEGYDEHISLPDGFLHINAEYEEGNIYANVGPAPQTDVKLGPARRERAAQHARAGRSIPGVKVYLVFMRDHVDDDMAFHGLHATVSSANTTVEEILARLSFKTDREVYGRRGLIRGNVAAINKQLAIKVAATRTYEVFLDFPVPDGATLFLLFSRPQGRLRAREQWRLEHIYSTAEAAKAAAQGSTPGDVLEWATNDEGYLMAKTACIVHTPVLS